MIERFRDSDLSDIVLTLNCCALLDSETQIDRLPVDQVRAALEEVGTLNARWTGLYSLAWAISSLRNGDLPEAERYSQAGLNSAAPDSLEQPRPKQQAALHAISSIIDSASDRSGEANEARAAARETIEGHIQHRGDAASSALPRGGPMGVRTGTCGLPRC